MMGMCRGLVLMAVLGCAACTGAPVAGGSVGLASAVPSLAPGSAAPVVGPSAAASAAPVASPKAEAHDLSKVLEESCLHLVKGPSEAVAADTGKLLELGHKRFDVSLAKKDASYAGNVSVAVGEAGEAVLVASGDFPISVRQGTKVVELKRLTQALTGCAAGAVAYELDWEVGPVQIAIGPTQSAQVSLTIEAAEEHEDGEDSRD